MNVEEKNIKTIYIQDVLNHNTTLIRTVAKNVYTELKLDVYVNYPSWTWISIKPIPKSYKDTFNVMIVEISDVLRKYNLKVTDTTVRIDSIGGTGVESTYVYTLKIGFIN